MRIYILSGGKYTEVKTSPTFPLVIVKQIPKFIIQAKKDGQMSTIRAFRTWVRGLENHHE
ncbi:MAG: hypothetical protein QNJ36_15040 [Calothrix sp. MO_167.B42]|nr:hypothetical protein [Calothrix sp. MO_167.B42]